MTKLVILHHTCKCAVFQQISCIDASVLPSIYMTRLSVFKAVPLCPLAFGTLIANGENQKLIKKQTIS